MHSKCLHERKSCCFLCAQVEDMVHTMLQIRKHRDEGSLAHFQDGIGDWDVLANSDNMFSSLRNYFTYGLCPPFLQR